MFWTKVEKFKNVDDAASRSHLAKEIYNEHLSPLAGTPVNVDASTRSATEQNLSTANTDIFQAAQSHVSQGVGGEGSGILTGGKLSSRD